jgi:hypothetical protein
MQTIEAAFKCGVTAYVSRDVTRSQAKPIIDTAMITFASFQSLKNALSEEIDSRKSEDAFNARMEDVDATYDLSEEDRKVLASEVEAINLDEASFEEYKSKLSVMWAHKSKEYLAEQEKAFEEKLEAELQKRLQGMETSEASDASDTSEETETEESEASEEVEEVLENAETEEEEVIANNNTTSAVEEVSLREKFAEAFAKENISIKF